MSIFSRFFGKKEQPSDAGLVADATNKSGLSLQVLFAEPMRLPADELTRAFRAYHPSTAQGRWELDPALQDTGEFFGLAGWEQHVIQLVGFNLPMPPDFVEKCVAPSHYSQELKARARAHSAHLLLYYAGRHPDRLEQYVALAAVAGVLADYGAIVVLNEAAHTSFPAAALSARDIRGDILDQLRNLPLPALYCGFVKYETSAGAVGSGLVDGDPTQNMFQLLDQLMTGGVWMRTHGADLLHLPDLAARASGHEEGQKYFDLFDNMLRYLLQSGARFSAGHTAQVGENTYVRFRKPTSQETFLTSEGQVLVVEEMSPQTRA